MTLEMGDCKRSHIFLVLAAVFPEACLALETDPHLGNLIAGVTAERLLEHVEILVNFGTRRWDQPGGMAAQEFIEGFFSELDLDEVYLQDFDAGADNVIGVLLGREHPGRLHVLGAHYDSVNKAGSTASAPGADDNGSGTAALLEAARAISSSGLRPAETIIFAAFSAEETGRKGSRALVAELKKQEKIVVDMICMDVIGYVHPGTEPDLSVSSSTFTPEIDDLIDDLRDVAAAYLPDWPFEGGPGCG